MLKLNQASDFGLPLFVLATCPLFPQTSNYPLQSLSKSLSVLNHVLRILRRPAQEPWPRAGRARRRAHEARVSSRQLTHHRFLLLDPTLRVSRLSSRPPTDLHPVFNNPTATPSAPPPPRSPRTPPSGPSSGSPSASSSPSACAGPALSTSKPSAPPRNPRTCDLRLAKRRRSQI